jgi:hypothetical protein
MGLVNLTTDLKSLRYGKDRIGGGSSGQPYIQSSFPKNLNDTDKTGGPDFLLRGGLLTPGRIVKDASRLTKMFIDTKSPNGLLFIAKQNVLSRTGVATQASGIINEGAYLPTSTLLQSAGNAIGLHLNKQGLDPTYGLGKDGGSLLPFKDPLGLNVYSSVVKEDQSIDENRLIQLTKSKLYGITQTGNTNNIPEADTEILSYSGGPNSKLGIGRTKIRRWSYTNNNLSITNDSVRSQNYVTLSSAQLGEEESSKNNGGDKIKVDFRSNTLPPNANFSNLPASLDYTKFNIAKRVNLGDPGVKGDKSSYEFGKLREDGSKFGPLDKLTALPLYKSDSVISNKIKNDLVKFRIGVIDNDTPTKKTYIHFRAFIDDYKDTYNAKWNSANYLGRADKVHNYQGFDRSITLSWTVAAQSKEELIPMYQKLNYLASTCAPDYSKYGYMRGNLITLTVGGWLYEQVGFIEGISYTVPKEAPWEISIPDASGKGVTASGIKTDRSVKEMPMMIKVSGFKFTPIHNFVPQVQDNNYGTAQYQGAEENFIKSYGPEQYIHLSDSSTGKGVSSTQSNYGDEEGKDVNFNTTYIPFSKE